MADHIGLSRRNMKSAFFCSKTLYRQHERHILTYYLGQRIKNFHFVDPRQGEAALILYMFNKGQHKLPRLLN